MRASKLRLVTWRAFIQLEGLGKANRICFEYQWLAGLYKTTGAYGKAEPRYLECMAVASEGLGRKHLDYAVSLNKVTGTAEQRVHG